MTKALTSGQQAARAALENSRSVLFLVPEIGLTPILRARVAERFAGAAMVIHSALPVGERIAAWDDDAIHAATTGAARDTRLEVPIPANGRSGAGGTRRRP